MVRSTTNPEGRSRHFGRRVGRSNDTLNGLPSAPLGPGWRSAAANLLATGEAAVQRRRSIRHLRRSATNPDTAAQDSCTDADIEKLPLHVHDNNEGVFVDGEGPMFPDIRIRFDVDPPNSIIMTLNNDLHDDHKPTDSFLLTKLELVVPYKSDGLVFASLDKITVEDLSVYDSQCLPLLERYSSQLKQPLGPGINRNVYQNSTPPSSSSFAPVHYHSSPHQSHTRQLEDASHSPRPHKRAKKAASESPPPILPFPTNVTPCAYFNSYAESIESVPFAPPQRLTIDLDPGRATRYLAIRFLNSHGSRFDASRVKAYGGCWHL